jgi:hypothetical protein
MIGVMGFARRTLAGRSAAKAAVLPQADHPVGGPVGFVFEGIVGMAD